MSEELDTMLGSVGQRLRELRLRREVTLTELAERTGISVSTLSRLESGQRRPTLELLWPLARAHDVSLDELVDAPATGDPRVRLRPVVRHGRSYLPLTNRPGGLRAYKVVIPGGPRRMDVPLGTHEGYEWLYVLDGRLRLLLGEHDLVLEAGEAAEFDTRTPHAVEPADDQPVELMTLFGPQGERAHVRARTRTAAD
ncbi:transcriptional regulator with XRE-family HTH domain [Friedmanniella endophytica]|uniref:Transcriptional regulator with XRE-family HTH domain n=1 Tax=Microlunatus kandeliicorticis TaxID=1759536 RepID=A0A7W3IT21_9ACTN|nr:helix-turn-helix domain-containing protein [Microlunatus kandeliicorticis]MBA8794738.1 transcriptional regulator with XRE-family HTH domain [Microlunatus kandeliicorticis]